jgi:hypothetical protein
VIAHKSSGESHTLIRQPDGNFHCPCTAFKDKNPDTIQNHVVSKHQNVSLALVRRPLPIRSTRGMNSHRSPFSMPQENVHDVAVHNEQTHTTKTGSDIVSASSSSYRPSVIGESSLMGQERMEVVDEADDTKMERSMQDDLSPCSVDIQAPTTIQSSPDIHIATHRLSFIASATTFTAAGSMQDTFVGDNSHGFSCSHPTSNTPLLSEPGPLGLPLEESDGLIAKYDLRIEPRLRIIFCLNCGIAVRPTDARGHAVTHFPSVPPSSIFETIFAHHQLDGTVKLPEGPISPILGLKHVSGYKCNVLGCGFLSISDRNIRQHFHDKHPHVTTHSNVEPTMMHKIYEFRGHTKLIETRQGLATSMPKDAFETYWSSHHIQRNAPSVEYRRPNDARQLSGFLYASKWYQPLENCDINAVRALVQYPAQITGDHYLFLVQAVTDYITELAASLKKPSTLFCRLINSSTECVNLVLDIDSC